MDNVAVIVTEELNLNVLGLVEEPLNKNRAVAKSRFGFGGGSLEGFLQRLLVAHDSHATTTTAVGGLDDDGETIFVCEGLDLLVFLNCTLGSGHNGDVGSNSKFSGRDLVAKGVDNFWRGTNELEGI